MHAVIAASLLGSCAEEPPAPLETKYARIYTTDYEGPLCAGDAAHVDRRIEMLAARFSTVAPIDLQIHIGLLPPDECGKSTFGCFDPAGNTILTHWDSLDHELVHAVAAQVEWRGQMPLRPFWQEGIAEAYDGERSRRSGSVLAEYPKTSSAELSYSTAGHFAAWVREEHGDEAIAGILRGEDEAEIFGTPVENLVAQYEAEAPWLIPGRNFCAGPQLEVEDVLSFSRRITCEDAATRTPFKAYQQSYTLQILNAGDYLLTVRPGIFVGLLQCQLEPLPERPDAPPSDVAWEGSSNPHPSVFEHDVELYLEAGSYDLRVSTLEEGEAGFELTLLPE